MKKNLATILFLFFALSTFSQNDITDKDHFLQKSKKQKTAAWILTSVGTAGLITTLAVDGTQAVAGGLTTLFSLGTVEPEYKSYTVPYLISAACVVSGIYLFVVSSKNKKKAKAASVFIDIKNAQVLQGTVFTNKSFPAVGVKIHL